ncbi:type II toxin-antitoxin system PemK/MazF family toxin [Bdellovibrionota bacterium FG-1]
MKRGDVFWIDFNPSRGGEIQKVRPAIIVSNDISNEVLHRVQVVPLSSKTEKIYPCEALVTVNRKQSKAMADQIMTVAKVRLKNRLGKISKDQMSSVDRAICIQLDL